MKKRIYLIIISSLSLHITLAQGNTDNAMKFTNEFTTNLTKTKADLKDGWTKGGTINVAVNESGRNDYWIKGGEKFAIGIKGILDYNFDLKKGKSSWLNSFRARYGVTRATSTGKKFLKNDDYLNFSSIYASSFSKNWSYAGFFSVESQFEQFFLTPGYIKLGPGALYKPNEHFNLLLSPAMLNLTTKLAPSLKPVTAFGVDSGKITALGLGAFVQAKYNKDVAKGINYISVATVYSNYLDHPGNMVLDWANLFTLTVNKFVGATVSINARYNDFEIGRVQLQHSIGVGLSYKL